LSPRNKAQRVITGSQCTDDGYSTAVAVHASIRCHQQLSAHDEQPACGLKPRTLNKNNIATAAKTIS